MTETPLTAAHRARGVPLVTFKGALVPEAFAPLAAELAAVGAGAALVDLGWLGHVRVTGRHRARFVHNMCTCNIKALATGASNLGLFLDGKGHLVAQFAVDAEADSLRLELGREDVTRTLAQLVRFRVADQVEFTPEPGLSVLAVVGPAARAVVGAVAAELPEAERAFVDTTLAGWPARVRVNAGRLGVAGVDVTVAAEGAPAVWLALVAAGAAPLGQAAWDALRVAGGFPADGVDLDEAHVPLESERLAALIDWNKGCYLGQEVVCMMNDRGQPSRILRGLVLPAGDLEGLAPGAELFAPGGDDRAVARLGTLARWPGRETAIALAIVKRKFAAAGAELRLPGSGAARVEILPLEP